MWLSVVVVFELDWFVCGFIILSLVVTFSTKPRFGFMFASSSKFRPLNEMSHENVDGGSSYLISSLSVRAYLRLDFLDEVLAGAVLASSAS